MTAYVRLARARVADGRSEQPVPRTARPTASRKVCIDTAAAYSVMFRQGLIEARDKDAALAAGEEPKGAFWGLPSSFKGAFLTGFAHADTFNIVGVDTSLGCTPYVGFAPARQVVPRTGWHPVLQDQHPPDSASVREREPNLWRHLEPILVCTDVWRFFGWRGGTRDTAGDAAGLGFGQCVMACGDGADRSWRLATYPRRLFWMPGPQARLGPLAGRRPASRCEGI